MTDLAAPENHGAQSVTQYSYGEGDSVEVFWEFVCGLCGRRDEGLDHADATALVDDHGCTASTALTDGQQAGLLALSDAGIAGLTSSNETNVEAGHIHHTAAESLVAQSLARVEVWANQYVYRITPDGDMLARHYR
jgi:hypothetical protein